MYTWYPSYTLLWSPIHCRACVVCSYHLSPNESSAPKFISLSVRQSERSIRTAAQQPVDLMVQRQEGKTKIQKFKLRNCEQT